MKRRAFISSLPLLSFLTPAAGAESDLPSFRILPDGWDGASNEDMRAVVLSAMKMLWPYFPGRQVEPFVVSHVETVPMVHFERSVRREIIMDLATKGTQWSQLAYQFAHEFCHILANFDQDGRSNLWFEETLCETASLFTLRHMASVWKTAAPYPNWTGYAHALADYADIIIKGRAKILPEQLAEYYHDHEPVLRTNPTDRARNGAMAVVLLDYLEREPEHWEAVTWLNSTPSPPDETFLTYMNKWLHATPGKHQPFIAKIRAAFGITT